MFSFPPVEGVQRKSNFPGLESDSAKIKFVGALRVPSSTIGVVVVAVTGEPVELL